MKYGKLPAKEYEEIPRNKLFVDLIRIFGMRVKGHKYTLNLKTVTIIDPVTGWFEVTQYTDKIVVSIENLVETVWISRFSIPMKIMYDQGSKFIDHELRKSLIEIEYGVTAKPITLVNLTPNAIL